MPWGEVSYRCATAGSGAGRVGVPKRQIIPATAFTKQSQVTHSGEKEKKLANPLRQAVTGSLNRASRTRRPHKEIDWNRTILAKLKHYRQSTRPLCRKFVSATVVDTTRCGI